MRVFSSNGGTVIFDANLDQPDGELFFFGNEEYISLVVTLGELYLLVADYDQSVDGTLTETSINAGAYTDAHNLRVQWDTDGTSLFVDGVLQATTPYYIDISNAEMRLGFSYDTKISNLRCINEEEEINMPLLEDFSSTITGRHDTPAIDLEMHGPTSNFYNLEGVSDTDYSIDFGQTWQSLPNGYEIPAAGDKVVFLRNILPTDGFIKEFSLAGYDQKTIPSEISTAPAEILGADPGSYVQPVVNARRKGVTACRIPLFGTTISFLFRKEGETGYLIYADGATAEYTPTLQTSGVTVSAIEMQNTFFIVNATFDVSQDYVYLLCDNTGGNGVAGRVDDISTSPLPEELVKTGSISVSVKETISGGFEEQPYKHYTYAWQAL